MTHETSAYRRYLVPFVQEILAVGDEEWEGWSPSSDAPPELRAALTEDARAVRRYMRETAKKHQDERQIDLDLMLAAGGLNIEAVEDLLSRGADPLAANSNALLQAVVVAGEAPMARALLEAGADPNCVPDEEWEVLFATCEGGEVELRDLRERNLLPFLELAFMAGTPRAYWPEMVSLLGNAWDPEVPPAEYLLPVEIPGGFGVLLRGPMEPLPDRIGYPYRLFVCKAGSRGWKWSLNIEHASMGGFFLGAHQFRPFAHFNKGRSPLLSEEEFLDWAKAQAAPLLA